MSPENFGAAIRFERRRQIGRKLGGYANTYYMRSEDGTLALRAHTMNAGTGGDTIFVDAQSGVPQFAVHPKRKVLNLKYDVLDTTGSVIGRLKQHMGGGRSFWSILDGNGEERATIVAPDTILQQFLMQTLNSAREAYTFVMGEAAFATLTQEQRPRQYMRGIKKFLYGLFAPRDWVLRMEPDNVAGLDPRVLIAGALMMQELTVTGIDD